MKTTEHPPRSRVMRLLRASPLPVSLLFVAGVAMTGFAATHPDGAGAGPNLLVIGISMLLLSGAGLIAILWGSVYLHVVEASRGMPGLRSVSEPEMESGSAAKLQWFKSELADLGFKLDGWFSLDDFDETHVGTWRHGRHHTVAYVLYYPAGRIFRMRFIRCFPDGGVLATSTRLNDVAVAPPQGIYVQVLRTDAVKKLWAWHLEAESLFPTTEPAAEVEPRDQFVEVCSRWAAHIRRDRTWLLAVEPVEECWRMYWLSGMPLREQFEKGWTSQYWQ